MSKNVQFIGQNYATAAVNVNLLPGINLPSGIWQVDIEFISQTFNPEACYFSHTSYLADTKELQVNLSQDVRDLTVRIQPFSTSHSSLSIVAYSYKMRVDRLILLNLATRLIPYKKI